MELFFNFLLVRQFSAWHFNKFCINVNQKAKIEFLLHFDYTGALMLSDLPVKLKRYVFKQVALFVKFAH